MPLAIISRKSKEVNQEVNKVVLLPLCEIRKSPNQPRKYFDVSALEELSSSIVVNGLLQPVTVRKLATGGYELVAGERRTMAFRSLGRDYIPAIVEEYSDEQSAVLSLIENLQRKDLNFFEEAQGIARLMQELNLTQQQISVKLGKAQSTVANKLRLLRYPQEVQQKIIDAGLTERHARTLLGLPPEAVMQVIEYIVAKNLNVEQAEQYVMDLLAKQDKRPPTKIFIVKDMRIFINSIKKAVLMMNQAGIPVDSAKSETEEYIEYTIRIPKTAVYKRRSENVV